jgi:hypothetical protein
MQKVRTFLNGSFALFAFGLFEKQSALTEVRVCSQFRGLTLMLITACATGALKLTTIGNFYLLHNLFNLSRSKARAPVRQQSEVRGFVVSPILIDSYRNVVKFKKLCFTLLPVLTACLSTHSQAAITPPVILEDEAEANFDLRCTLKVPNLKLSESKTATAPAAVLLGYEAGGSYLSLTFSGKSLSLNRVVKGRATTLSTAKPIYTPSAENKPVVIQWREGNLRVIYNSQTVLRKDNLSELNGGVAIASAKSGIEVIDPAVQPVEPVEFADDFMRSATVPDLWQAAAGTWKLNTAGDPKLGANPFSYVAQGKPAMSVAGRWFWSDYAATVSVKPSGEGAIGVIVYWQDDKNYLACKWYAENAAGDPATKKQLWRVVNGQAMMLAGAPGGYQPKQWYRLAVSAADGLIKMSVDGTPVLEKRTDLFGQGKFGLLSETDSETMFDDVQVQPASETLVPGEQRLSARPSRFAKDASMEEWASPKGQWLAAPIATSATVPNPPATAPTQAAKSTLWWNRGTFFGDYEISINATNLASDGKAQVILAGDGTTPESGYALQVQSTPDSKAVQSVLLRSGKPVSTETTTLLSVPATCHIKLQRVGSTLEGFVGAKKVATFTDSQPLNGRRAGYGVERARVAFTDAHVTDGNMTDYTFFRAPTDWQITSGTWDMASRWICTPGWSWYAGWSDRIAAAWNKRSFEGDFAVEVFVASKMDSPTPPYYLHPRDLNITVCGDGRDLASGYSLIFGGWNNTATRILRGTETVAETDKVLLPSSATYHAKAHHKWFCLRVEKTGDTISYYVDRNLALQYKDPKPLTGKRLALWTSGNGIMIARATIYTEKMGTVEMEPGVLTAVNHLVAAPTEKLNLQVRGTDPAVSLSAIAPTTAEEKPAVRAINVGGGGNFAIAPQIEPFDALQMPKLDFQCRIEPGAEVNLYLRVKGVYHAVRLNGPTVEQDAEGVKGIGSAEILADGKWHDVSLNLASLLKALYPTESQLTVEEMFIGNLARDTYRQAGFGANYPGTSYLIRGFNLQSADGRLAKLVEPELKTQAPSSAQAKMTSFHRPAGEPALKN